MKELLMKIKQFEEKSGLDLYEEIKDELYKRELRIEELIKSRDNWKKKYLYSKKEVKQKQ